MSDSLHQMTIEYRPEHDRLLFRVTTQSHNEYRVWLTRRLVRGLWAPVIKTFKTQPDIQEHVAEDVKQAVMSIKHQEIVQAADFTQKHDPEATPDPSTVEPLLVNAVQCVPGEGDTVRLTFKSGTGRDVNLNINEKMLHAFCHLIRSAVDKAEWDLDLPIGDAAFAVSGEGGKLH